MSGTDRFGMLEMDGWQFGREEETGVVISASHQDLSPVPFGEQLSGEEEILATCEAIQRAVDHTMRRTRRVIARDLDAAAYVAVAKGHGERAVALGVAAELVARGISVAVAQGEAGGEG